MTTPAEPTPTPTEVAPKVEAPVSAEAPKSAAVVTPAPATPAPAAKTAADVKADSKAKSEEKSLLDQASDEVKGVKKEDGTVAAPETPVVPEKYELKAPEGMDLDPVLVTAFEPIAKKLKLTNEAAQELTDMYAAHVKVQAEQAEAERIKARDAEILETKTTLGGNYKEQMSLAAKARDRFFSPATIERMTKAGIGNNIAFIQDCIKIGKLISEGKLEEGVVIPEGSDAKKMFPSMK